MIDILHALEAAAAVAGGVFVSALRGHLKARQAPPTAPQAPAAAAQQPVRAGSAPPAEPREVGSNAEAEPVPAAPAPDFAALTEAINPAITGEPVFQPSPDEGPYPELPMSINTAALASRVLKVGVTASEAVTIVEEVVSLIGVAENLYEGIKGDAKFQAVMSGLNEVVAEMGLTAKLAAIKAAVGPMVNLVVSVLNSAKLWGSVFGSIASLAQTAASEIATIGHAAAPAPQPAA